MATLKRYIINGVTLHPTSAEENDIKIEDSERMANGTLRTWLRAYKKKWNLSWSGLHEDYVPALRTLYRIVGSYILNDETNTNYTVVSRSFTAELSAEREANDKLYYDVEMEWEEV